MEIPQPLLATMMRIGSSCPGRDDQIRQDAKSASAEPASPPWTMVIPVQPGFLWAMAVPGAIENCTSIGLETGHIFHSRAE